MAAAVAVLASTIGMLALLAVMIFWGAGNTTAALPYFAVPGVLWAIAIVCGSLALRPRLHH